MSLATGAVAAAAARGAPSRRDLVKAVAAGALAQLATVALVGGATGLLVWSSERPGLAAVAGLLLVVEVVAFLRAPLRHAERLAAHDLGLEGLVRWRTWLLDAVATWSPSRLAAARVGDVLTRCLEDTDRLQDLWVRALVPVASTTVALLLAAVALAVAVPVAGLAVALATLFTALATWARVGRVCALGTEEADVRGAVAARAVEFAHGAEALRLLGADVAHGEATLALVARADHLAARRDAVVAQLGVLAATLAAVAFVVVVGAVPLPTGQPALDAGVVLAALACGELVGTLPAALDPLGPIAGAAARLGALAEPAHRGSAEAPRGGLAVEDVDVAPAKDGPVLLASVSVTAAPAQRVAVLGPTGSGKSSLLAVAAGLEPPRRGVVRLGGADVVALEERSLRRRLGWLPTSPALLEGRVRDVLDVGRGLDDERLAAALRAVGLDTALEPRGGLDAVVGERGEDLSGGERRRLALARLLAGAPDVYVLDEPTAGLDADAADRSLAAVAATGGAVLVATHDPRVVAWASQRRVIADGRLVEGPRR